MRLTVPYASALLFVSLSCIWATPIAIPHDTLVERHSDSGLSSRVMEARSLEPSDIPRTIQVKILDSYPFTIPRGAYSSSVNMRLYQQTRSQIVAKMQTFIETNFACDVDMSWKPTFIPAHDAKNAKNAINPLLEKPGHFLFEVREQGIPGVQEYWGELPDPEFPGKVRKIGEDGKLGPQIDPPQDIDEAKADKAAGSGDNAAKEGKKERKKGLLRDMAHVLKACKTSKCPQM